MDILDLENLENLEKAKEKRNNFKNEVISITGTCGKSTTSKFIYDIIKEHFIIDKTEKNSNSFKGIPWCINNTFSLKSKYWVIELGIADINEMIPLLNLIKPHIRIITNVGIAHIDSFKDGLKGYINEKLKYLENIPENTVLILNNDDNILAKKEFPENIKVIKCGSNKTDDFQIFNYKCYNIYSEIYIKIKENEEILKFKINGIGRHLCINLCLAIACVKYLNIDIKKNILDLYKDRGYIYKNNNIYLYDYTYNCVPTSIVNLDAFKDIDIKKENKIIILGDMYYGYFLSYFEYQEEFLKKSMEITDNIFVYSKHMYKTIINRNNYNIKNFEKYKKIKIHLINFLYTKKDEKIYIYIQGTRAVKMEIISNFIIKKFKLD